MKLGSLFDGAGLAEIAAEKSSDAERSGEDEKAAGNQQTKIF